MKKLFILFLAVFLLAACGEENEDPVEETEPEEVEDVEEEPQEEEKEDESAEEDSWDDVKNMDNIVGKSDKDFTEITGSSPSDVRNDNTGNWRYTTISENVDIVEYALSYRDLHMNENEVHFIINFNYNTTTTLNDMGGLLYVDSHEYEDGEEHDASTLGSGMFLKSYMIYPDGDIEEIE